MKAWKAAAGLALGILAMVSVGRLYDPAFVDSQAFVDRFGISTVNSIACASFGTLAVADNVNRNYLYFLNESDTDMRIRVGASATSGIGFRLRSSATAPMEFIAKVPVGFISCMHLGTGGTKTLQVIEGQR